MAPSSLSQPSSDALRYGAVCYTLNPLTIVPDGEGFLVGFGFSGNREYIGAMSPEQLIEFLRSARAQPKRRVVEQLSPLPDLGIEL